MADGTSRADRILEWADSGDERTYGGSAQALQADGGDGDFDGEQLGALVLAVASINLWNRVNVTTRQVAGQEW